MDLARELIGSPFFWIFGVVCGGGMLIGMVAIVAEAITKSQKLRAQEREKERQREIESHRALMGLTESDDIAGLKLRMEALEQDMARLEGLLQGVAPRRVGVPASVPAEQTYGEQVIDA